MKNLTNWIFFVATIGGLSLLITFEQPDPAARPFGIIIFAFSILICIILMGIKNERKLDAAINSKYNTELIFTVSYTGKISGKQLEFTTTDYLELLGRLEYLSKNHIKYKVNVEQRKTR